MFEYLFKKKMKEEGRINKMYTMNIFSATQFEVFDEVVEVISPSQIRCERKKERNK